MGSDAHIIGSGDLSCGEEVRMCVVYHLVHKAEQRAIPFIACVLSHAAMARPWLFCSGNEMRNNYLAAYEQPYRLSPLV